MNKQGKIGILDSGVGGLSVLRHVRNLLPAEEILYVADQAHVPYGARPVEELQQFSRSIASFLLNQQAKIIVVACNTASAAALEALRKSFPDLPIVGMEPAIKPGAFNTKSGKIGVLATPGTFDSVRYAGLMARFAGEITIYEDPCLGLVELIEEGQVESPSVEQILVEAIKPMIGLGVDTLVLGCTHYPFVIPLIHQISGPEISVIDPAPAVALQVKRVLEETWLLVEGPEPGHSRAYTTGDSHRFTLSIRQLLDQTMPVEVLEWSGQELVIANRAGRTGF